MATFNGGSGNDNSYPTIGQGTTDDTLFGNGGNDKLQGYGGSDSLFGGTGDDTLYGNNAPGVDQNDGDDFLYGQEGNDTLYGGDGDDYLDPGSGTNVVDGGAGTDTVAYIGSNQAVTASLASGSVSAGSFATDTLTGVENLAGSNLADTITGSFGNNRISGFGGNDNLNGGSGTDTATFLGSRANYVVTRLSDVSIQIVDNRTTEQIDADQVHSTYKVSDGTDTLTDFEFFRFKDATYSVADLLNNGTPGDDFLTGTDGAEEMHGFSGNDTISGLDGDDLLDGGSGRDSLFGDGGDDTLLGGTQDDYLDGGNGSDSLFGMGGDDTLLGAQGGDDLDGGGGRDLLDGGIGADRMAGGPASDAFIVDDAGDDVVEAPDAGPADMVEASISYKLAPNVERLRLIGDAETGNGNGLDNRIWGTTGPNVLKGGGGDDWIAGNSGRDRVIGGDGDDTLFGGAGNDQVVGGKGNDVLAGLLGRDVMVGGTGEDEFRFLSAANSGIGKNRDVIQDFVHGIDQINLKKVDGNAGENGNQKLKYIGSNSFSGEAGEFRTTAHVLSADLDGDGSADFQLKVDGLASATQHDFIV